MQVTLGWCLIVFGGLLYLAQIISSVDFRLAQRLGFQENPEKTDTIVQTAEQYTAYWDLVTLGWLPLAGVLMVFDSRFWPIVALVGGTIYLDAAGREATKILSFRKEGFRLGGQFQQIVLFRSYLVMAIIGLFVVFYSATVLL